MGALSQIPGAATPIENILMRFPRDKLADFIEVAISLLDVVDGDPDTEEDDHNAYDGDEGDWSRPEFHTVGRNKEPKFIGATKIAAIYDPEDREMDDPPEDDGQDRCSAGDDMIRGGGSVENLGWGFVYHIGDDVDAERTLQPTSLNDARDAQL